MTWLIRVLTNDHRDIARPLKFVFGAILTIILIIFLTRAIIIQSQYAENGLQKVDVSVATNFRHETALAVEGLEETLIGVSRIPNLQTSLLENDRDGLYEIAKPLLDELQSEYDVTGFTFLRPDLSVVLRVHARHAYGDTAKYYAAVRSAATMRDAGGLEVTGNGRLMIRAVHPWFLDGKHIGFLELAKPAERLLEQMEEAFAVGLVTVIRQDVLATAHEETPSFGTPAHSRLPRTSTDGSVKPLKDDHGFWSPDGKYFLLGQHEHGVSRVISDHLSDKEATFFFWNLLVTSGGIFHLTSLPLLDAENADVGRLLITRNVTQEVIGFLWSQVFTIGLAMVPALFAWLFFRQLAMAIQLTVSASHDQLENLVKARTKDLAAHKQRLQDAQEVAQIGSWDWNISDGTIHWSDQNYRIIRSSRETPLSDEERATVGHIHPDYRASVESALERALSGGARYEIGFEVVRPNGDVRWVFERANIEFDTDGHPVRMYGISHDITEKHKADALSQRLAHILDASLNEIYVVNAATGRFVNVNEGARRNLGYSMDALYDMSDWDLKPEISEDKFQEMTAPLARGDEEVLRYETVHRRADGSTYPVEVLLQYYGDDKPSLFVQIVNDLTDQKKKESEIEAARARAERLAYRDTLTGLGNRACCIRDAKLRLQQRVANQKIAVIHCDLDRFKSINDTLGHSAGDRLLSELGSRLALSCYPSGSAYRWGGDEFVVIMQFEDISELDVFCDNLVQTLRRSLDIDSTEVFPSMSLGVAWCPDHGVEFETLLNEADLALYRTKNVGGDTYAFYASDMRDDAEEEAIVERHLHHALGRDELFMVYQPQVDSQTRRVTGIEALIRWKHPERGVIGPGVFMDIAERTRLAPDVGRFVIDESLSAAAKWRTLGYSFNKIGVNLSPRHMQTGELVSDLARAIDRHGLDAPTVAVEVLESLVLDETRFDAKAALDELRGLGVSVELDDFGTGYASLSHLTNLPIDTVKIDRMFASQMLVNERKAVVVQSLMNLSRLLDLNVICEGIETEEQLARLQEMGVCSIQGFLIARPMPFDAMCAWLEKNADGVQIDNALASTG